MQVQPEFPGGMEALSEYLRNNIHYPQMARENEIQGRVFVRFVVEKDGSLSEVRVMRDIGGGCGEEAARVVGEMPRWMPARIGGRAVRCEYTLPVIFRLN